MPKLDSGALNDLFIKAESCDKELFAEMRSNILLTGGMHYGPTSSRLWERIKTSDRSEPQKLRLTKNHVQKIVKTYVNGVINNSPGVKVFPYNEDELQDQKAAEINDSVWQDIKERLQVKRKTREWANQFLKIGEVACKIFWDPNKGELIGFRQQLSPDGEPMLKEDGSPLADKTLPVFSGDIVIEPIFGFNLLRDPAAECMEDSPYLIVRKMHSVKTAKRIYDGNKEAQRLIQESGETTFKVFDGQSGRYDNGKGMVMFREHYYRPCMEYPNGYYYITTEAGVLEEGELPFGIFPIVWEGDEEIETSPRRRSIIKHLRPYQSEINRAASSIATTQITLGDDRVFVTNGSKITKGVHLPGMRVFHTAGGAPTIQGGRSGEQYFQYLQAQITEMYQIANLAEVREEKETNAQDVFPLLYRSLKDKQRFSEKAEKFESFLVRVAETSLQIAKKYYPDWKVVRAAGRREAVNIAEFKNSDPRDIRIKVEAVSEDIHSTLGRAMQINQIIQFLGSDLPDEERGNLIRSMPFLNGEQIVGGLTLDYDNITSDILALDRGEFRPVGKYDNHKEYIRHLTNRIKKKDFGQLPSQVQEMYALKLQEHEAAEAELQNALLAAQKGFIPSGGALAKADLYVNRPGSNKPERATFPTEALQWLRDQLERQGSSQEQLQILEEQNIADMAAILQQQNQLPQQGVAPSGVPLPPGVLPLPQGGI